MSDEIKIAMQIRCVHCGKEQYAPAVYPISMGEGICNWCGKKSEKMAVDEYRRRLIELEKT